MTPVDLEAARRQWLQAALERSSGEWAAKWASPLMAEVAALRAALEELEALPMKWRKKADESSAEGDGESLHASGGLYGRAEGLREAADNLTAALALARKDGTP